MAGLSSATQLRTEYSNTKAPRDRRELGRQYQTRDFFQSRGLRELCQSRLPCPAAGVRSSGAPPVEVLRPRNLLPDHAPVCTSRLANSVMWTITRFS